MDKIIIPVNDRLYSTLKIGSDAFPFMLSHDDLSNFVRGFVNWHQQKNLEISFILEGSVRVCLLSEEHLLHARDSFLILADTLHSIQPVDDEPGRYFTVIFDPCLLTGYSGSFFEQTCYSPVIASIKGYQCIPGNPASPYSDAIREHLFCIYNIYDHAADGDCRARLEIQRRLQDVWLLMLEHGFTPAAERRQEDSRILAMLNYLRAHYDEKFSLSDMAAHHHISRGECCRYFKKIMGMTITEYLLDYRLSKAAQRLALTTQSITSIAHASGFHSASSFSQEFRKKTGLTPSGYRAQHRTVRA